MQQKGAVAIGPNCLRKIPAFVQTSYAADSATLSAALLVGYHAAFGRLSCSFESKRIPGNSKRDGSKEEPNTIQDKRGKGTTGAVSASWSNKNRPAGEGQTTISLPENQQPRVRGDRIVGPLPTRNPSLGTRMGG